VPKRKTLKDSTQKKLDIKPSKGSPMDKFHQAMKKIVSVSKNDLKEK
jgi:hypothetical protein